MSHAAEERALVDGVSATIQECLTTSSARVIAIIGLVKNAGKTTTVNALLTTPDVCFGLTSLGLDGEAVDHLTGLAKPRIHPPVGTIVATTEGSLQRSRGSLDVLERLPFRTPLGRVLIGRAAGDGLLEVSGPTTLTELRATVERLQAHGAERVLVDGAINRLGSASPRISDAVILATGGMAGDSMAEVLDSTRAVVDLLTLPRVRSRERDLLAPLVDGATEFAVLDDRGLITPVPATQDGTSGRDVARAVANLGRATLFVRGALTEGLVSDLVQLSPSPSRLRVVVRDATVVVGATAMVARCRKAGMAFEVLAPLRLLAVTANPFSLPASYDPGLFFASLRAEIGDRCALFDVVNGLASAPAARPVAKPFPEEGC